MFLDSAVSLKESHAAKVRFVIIGDGNLRRDLEEQAKSLGLENEVTFLGTRNDPEYFYPALDIVALTSLNEGTPLTLIEAMANARPIVATAVGGVVDLLGPATAAAGTAQSYQICDRGISVPSGDTEGFAHALARLIEDPLLCNALGQRGLEFVSRNYAKERLLTDMAELYRDLMPVQAAQPPEVRKVSDLPSQ